jgi:hypothetical protein
MRSPSGSAGKRSSPALFIVGGALGLALASAVGGGLWWSHKQSMAIEASSATPTQAPPAAVHEPAAPAASALAAASSPSVAPAVPEPASFRPAAAAQPLRSAQSAVGSAAPPVKVAAPRQTGRADERGLAKDNPFK